MFMISTYIPKGFSWKKNDLNSPDFEGKKISIVKLFYDKF
jgi:hypothetical protein